MLHIHFEPEDLSRTTVAASGDVLWEVLLGLHTLQERTVQPPFARWRRRIRPLIPHSLHQLFELAPPRGYSADFLTPTRGLRDLDEGLEAVLATPRDQLDRDFAQLAAQRRTSYLRSCHGADRTALLRTLTREIKRFFTIAVAPHWREISRDIEADRIRHLRTLGDHGVGRLLASLHPNVRWRHPVLQVDDYVDQHLYLRGRGLVLLPSYFNRHHPITLMEPDLPPVLVFPVSRRAWPLDEEWHGPDTSLSLAGLMGRTRTTVLQTTVNGCSTTDIAVAADISLASVSHHTKVLRQNGLITTQRDGCTVCHQITDLGLSLLESAGPVDLPGSSVSA